MFGLAYKNLIQEKAKLLISVAGVTLSVLLVIVLVGLYQGLSTKLGEYIQTVPADIWVAQKGSKNLFDSTSILASSDQSTLEAVDGVSSVKTFSGRQTAIEIAGEEKAAFVVGLGGNSGAVAPKVIEGTADIQPGEIILDRSVKSAQIGQTVAIGGKPFRVAGLMEGGNVLIATYAFMTSEEAAELFKQTDVVNYFIIKLDTGADTNAVARQIQESIPGSTTFDRASFAENTTSIVKEVFLPIIAVLAVIGIAVGVTVIGLTIFTATLEKSKEYGVLKAIGISNSQLYIIVLQQSMLTSFIGYIVGVLAGFGFARIAGELVPGFVVHITAANLAIFLTATLAMGAVASLLPARRITRIDPAEVFKA